MALHNLPLDKWKELADTFQAFATGIGALIGGLGALKISGEWVASLKRKREIRKWRRRFPKSHLNDTFKLIYPTYEDVISGAAIYIYDLRAKVKHWVVDPETLEILGFNFNEARGLPHEQCDAIKDAEEIILSR